MSYLQKKKKTAESYQKMVALIWEWTKDADTWDPGSRFTIGERQEKLKDVTSIAGLRATNLH